MQILIRQSAGATDGPCGIQDSAQGLVHGLFIGKSFGNFRLQHHNIGPLAQPLYILAPYAALHPGQVILGAHIAIRIAVSFLHKTLARAASPDVR